MEYFKRAKAVRIRSQHNKYMIAEEDEEGVKQSRSGSSKNARWIVEPIEGKPNVIRLKSCVSWKYLRASDDPFLLGMTGRRVVQTSPRFRLDPSVEWEPIKEGSHVKLRTRRGNFLRANGGLPPWNNSITHDVPSRSSSQEWILWTVDVLEVDHESTEEVKEEVKVSGVPSVGCNVEDQGNLSRNSSTGSTISKADYYKDCHEDVNDIDDNASPVAGPPKSVRSVKRSSVDQISTPGSKASPKTTEKATRVSPFAKHVHEHPRNSDSFNKLKSMLDDLEDLLDDVEDKKSDADSDLYAQPTLHKPHSVDIHMAKQILKELTSLDYSSVLSSGRDQKLDKAVNILIVDAKKSSQGQVPKELADLQDQLKAMRKDYDSATQDLEDYTTFSTERLVTKAELKKDAAKALGLESQEAGLNDTLLAARAKREELLKQLEVVENSIKTMEKEQAENAVEIEELISRIGQKSESLRDMERKEKSWQTKKFEAENTLKRVEEDWVNLHSLFHDV